MSAAGVGFQPLFEELTLLVQCCRLDVVAGVEDGPPRCPTSCYGRLHRRLLRGVLMDGLDRGAVGRGDAPPYSFTELGEAPMDDVAPEKAARRFLGLIGTALRTAAPTVGLGSYRVLTGGVVGGELVHEGRLAHLSAFPGRRGADGGGSKAARRGQTRRRLTVPGHRPG